MIQIFLLLFLQPRFVNDSDNSEVQFTVRDILEAIMDYIRVHNFSLSTT